ncbi:ABC transporter ATP-binding protein [Streptomyces shenzhenensis]|uniref:ABC transporter ATP-binding protein n=1 Tax=Streptomyces shenzhenensis TaxID=943815 RepID=UPI0033CF73EC
MPSDDPILTVHNLTVTVTPPAGEPRVLLRDISLSLQPGRCVAVVGESGSGKTTLAKAVAGLLPKSMTLTGDLAPRGTVGYMFQDAAAALNPLRRVAWQIEEALRAQGMPRAERKAAVAEQLRRAEIPDIDRYARRYPHELSGGLAQRVLLAAVLAANPSILIADEPTSALDMSTQQRIAALLRRLTHDDGIGMLLITHDLTLAAQLADQIAVLYQGELVEQGDVEHVFTEPRHAYTRELVGALPRRTRPVRRRTEAP